MKGYEKKRNFEEIAIHYQNKRRKLRLGYMCARIRKLGWVDNYAF